MSANRLATRIAAREARRRPMRSLLVIILVALPVAGMTAATTILRSEARTPMRVFEDDFGKADLGFNTFVSPDDDGEVAEVAEALDLTPAGTEATTLSDWYQGVRSATDTAYVNVFSGDATAPIFGGRYQLLSGRVTRAGGEVAVSPALASRFGVGVGDRLVLQRPAVELDVVGIIEDSRHLDGTALHFVGEPPAALLVDGGAQVRVLLDIPGELDVPGALALLERRDSGTGDLPYFEIRPTYEIVDAILARAPWLREEADAAVRWSIVAGALVLAAVGIIIAAAFTVGARQQLTTLGQLSANGAPEKLLRRVLVLQGTVTGIVGACAGVVLASVGVRLARGSMEQLADHRIATFQTRPSDVLAIVAVGVVGASIAALIPARSAARIPTLRALAGRRPEERVSRRVTTTGVTAFAAGLAVLAVASVGASTGGDGNLWAAVAIVGGLGVLFGATATTPALVAAVAPLASRTRGVTRIAVRNLTRHRTRTGAVVAAVAAAGALAVGGTTIARSTIAEEAAYTTTAPSVVTLKGYSATGGGDQAPPRRAVAQVGSALPDAERHQLAVTAPAFDVSSPTVPEYGFGQSTAFVIDEGAAEALRLDDAVADALRDDGIVLVRFVDDDLTSDVAVTLDGSTPIPTRLAFSRYSVGTGTGLYISPAFAEEHGLETQLGPMLFSLPDPMTEVERFDLDAVRQDAWKSWEAQGAVSPDPVDTWDVSYTPETNSISRRVVETLLAATATLLALIVLGIGLALASADDREEATTLSVVGASPRVRSMTTATKAWVMATLGFLLAIPIGFLPVQVVRSSTQYATSAPFPVATVVGLVVLAPVIAAVVTLVVSSVAGRVRPLRMSTAMFD
ncbi:FtsX-like permease family protein [Actinospongicola halichondriae]|uniref:FtsX-like permease family protein n=1 Tax=Actinospongicola halichondriae TaxID=3236844 RepID=UPI003D433FC1